MTSNPSPRPLARLLVAQFFGAFNDNAWRLMVAMLAIRTLRAGGLEAGALETASQASTTLAFAALTVPLMVFSLPAALVADRISKRSLILAAKTVELVLLIAAAVILALAPGSGLPLLILALMGAQSAFFGPAKYGILPEILPHERLSSANGQLEMWTFLAIIAGTAVGGPLLDAASAHLWVAGGVLVAASAAGLAAARGLPRVPPAGSHHRTLASLAAGWSALRRERRLGLTVIGLTFYWSLASLLGQDVFVYAKSHLRLSDTEASLLLAAFGVGVGAGCFLAGRWSGRKVETGLIPLGAILMGVLTLIFGLTVPAAGLAFVLLAGLGLVSGFVIVPLNALLQWRSPSDCRGAVIALSNVFVFAGFLAGSLGAQLLSSMGLSASQIFLGASLLVFAGTGWALYLLPDALLRFFLVMLTWTFYRLDVVGREHVPDHGPALLVPNHVSFADGLFLMASLDRPIRFVVDAEYAGHPLLKPFMRALKAIPLPTAGGPREQLRAFRRAGEALDEGHLVCVFPEGQITRTGTLHAFRHGLARITRDRTVPVIPVHLDRVWGSVFSRAGGRTLLRIPPQIPRRVTVSLGRPLAPSTPLWAMRQAVHDLGRAAWEIRQHDVRPLHRSFVRLARRHPLERALVDDERGAMRRLTALTGAVCLARALRTEWAGRTHVGVLLPSSVPAALVNVAAGLAGRCVVNLNFTAGTRAVASAARQAGIDGIVTSRRFLHKAGLELPDGLTPIYLEDVRDSIGRRDRGLALLAGLALPTRWLERLCGAPAPARTGDIATVIFSSGSTGEPKGVMLTHLNIASNIEAATQVFPLNPGDRVLMVLPMFHAFGTMLLWMALHKRIVAVLHPNPLDAEAVGRLVQHWRVDFLPATPTFLQIWMRRCTPAQFGSLRLIICGAEKLSERLARGFEDQFGMKALEGYGATECSPVVACSTLDYRAPGFYQPGFRRGSVGKPLPGVSVRIVDPDSGEILPPGSPGMLQVRGPNVMRGYLGRPDLTEEAMDDGWYVTGDIAVMDEEGFLRITDRLSRFSKIGGEMVPHRRVEEALQDAAGIDEPAFAVTGVPDERRGERLAVLHTLAPERIPQIVERAGASGLPRLYLPRPSAFVHVEELPVLGTGKLDLRAVKRIAAEALLGPHTAPSS